MTHSPHHTELDLTSNYYTLNGDTDIATSASSCSNLPSTELNGSEVVAQQSFHSSPSNIITTLEHLHDPEPGGKLKFPYHKLIQYAIQGSQSRRLQLNDIAGAIAAKFPLRYNTPEKRKRLRNTVRHHLSLYPKFFLDGKPEGASGKAQFWAIDPLALNEPPRSNPEKERSKMSTSTTSRSTGPARISGRKKMDQGPTSNPGRSSRQQRMNPSLSLQPPSSPEETPGSSVPHSELSLEPSTFFPVSPQHAHFAVSPTVTQSHPVTPLFPSELSPSPFHPDITVYSDMAEDYNNQLSPGSSVGFPISPQLAHFMAVEPTIVQGFPNTPLLPSDPLFPVSQQIVSANSSSGYPASNVTVHYNIQQVMPSTFQPHIPQVHPAYPFQPFGIPPLPSTLDNDTPTSTIPFASTCSSYVDLDQGLQESSSSLLGYGFGSMMNTPLDFSFAQPEHGGISVSDWLSLSEMSSVENPQ